MPCLDGLLGSGTIIAGKSCDRSMPIARLITRTVEDAQELAADLRSRGFVVETVSPESIPSHPVDLEIRVEECSSEQALRNAEKLSATEDIHVFIAPGALIESLRPMKVVPLAVAPEVMADSEEETPVEADLASTPLAPTFMAEAEDVVEEAMPVEAVQLSSSADFPVNTPQLNVEEVITEPFSPQEPVETTPQVHALEAEEVYPPSDWPIWHPLADDEEPEEELAGVVVEGEHAAMAVSPSRRASGERNDLFFWRVATVAGVVAVSALLLGVSAHRFSPIPRGLETSTDQTLPFANGKGEKPLATAEQMVATAPVPTPTPEFKRVVATVPVVDRPSPAEHLNPHAQPAKRRSVQRAATRHEDDYVAEDTVTRFAKKPAQPRLEAQKKSGIKHYSDLR